MVVFCGKRYCLTRLGFGLNVVPQIMKTIVSAVLSQEEVTSAYLDDIYINKDISPALHIWAKLAVSPELQGPRVAWRWSECTGLRCQETGKFGSEHSWSSHKADCFFPVRKTCGAPASVWMSLCSSGYNKTQGKCSNKRIGQSNKWCPPHLNDCRKCWESSNTQGPCLRRVVHKWGRIECMAQCQFICIGSPVGEGQSCVGRCMLVWFVGFYGISTFVGYLTPNPFLCK